MSQHNAGREGGYYARGRGQPQGRGWGSSHHHNASSGSWPSSRDRNHGSSYGRSGGGGDGGDGRWDNSHGGRDDRDHGSSYGRSGGGGGRWGNSHGSRNYSPGGNYGSGGSSSCGHGRGRGNHPPPPGSNSARPSAAEQQRAGAGGPKREEDEPVQGGLAVNDGFRAIKSEGQKSWEDMMQKVKGKTSSERREIFNALPWEDKLRVNGFPPSPGFNTPLPEELPYEPLIAETIATKEKKQAAARHAVEETKKRFCSNAGDDLADEYDDDDVSMSSEESCDGTPYCNCRDCRSGKRPKKTAAEYDYFLLALPHCLIFDTAFRVRWPRKCDADLCWCPCGSYMKPWQEFFGLTNTEHVADAAKICGNAGGKKKAPFALLAHLRKQGDACPLHYGISKYLEEYYKDWNGTGLGHKYLYYNLPNAKDKYQEALSAESKQNQRMFKKMQAALLDSEERERTMRKENEEFQKKMESLDKVNHEYRLKVEEVNELLNNLGLEREEKEVHLSKRDYESYRITLDSYIGDLKAKNAEKKNKHPIRFAVENNFTLQKLLDDLDTCSSKENTFLLRDLSVKGRNDRHKHAPKLIFDWEITFGDAIDEGGPTKHFFDQVWQQIEALKVSAGDLEVRLFDKYFCPVCNDDITFANKQGVCSDAVEMITEKAKRYYRAIGRMMFHSIVRGMTISSTAMPVFYRNVIFRECNLKDDRYKHNKVIKDLQALGGNVKEQYDSMCGSAMSLYGIGDSDDELVTKENFISKVMHHVYIDQRQIAIEALREGITLDGYADIRAVLRIMPEKAISQLLFARANIRARDVIKAVKPQFSEATDEILDTQKLFFRKVFLKVIKEKSEDDETFLRDFLSFVTSQSFIPHPLARPDYEILVEFDLDTIEPKARPWSKTCANLLILPYHAYDCDKELFEELLTESLLQVKEYNFSAP